MEISPRLLFFLFAYSFFFGILLGWIYDLFRVMRMLFGETFSFCKRTPYLYQKSIPILNRPLKQSTFLDQRRWIRRGVLFLGDLAILLLAGIGLAVLCFHFNQGRFRFFTVPLLLLGFGLYRVTVCRIFLLFSEKILFLLRAIFSVVFYLVFRPFLVFFRILALFFKKIYANLIFSIAKIKEMLYNNRRKKSLLKKAQKAFLQFLFFTEG